MTTETGPIPPTGHQHEIRFGDQEAVATETGAGLRCYRVGEIDLLDGFRADEPCEAARGQLLLPWPNRVADGSWTWDGERHQLALTEPNRGHAIHGLTRWRRWPAEPTTGDDHVVLTTTLEPTEGWPFPLSARQSYRLTEDGLACTTTVTNIGRPAVRTRSALIRISAPTRLSSTARNC